jgi:excisionase family DNA binding protein
MQSDLMTIAQAAARRGVSKQAVNNWIKAGLPAQRFGNQYLITAADLARFIPRPRGRTKRP